VERRRESERKKPRIRPASERLKGPKNEGAQLPSFGEKGFRTPHQQQRRGLIEVKKLENEGPRGAWKWEVEKATGKAGAQD